MLPLFPLLLARLHFARPTRSSCSAPAPPPQQNPPPGCGPERPARGSGASRLRREDGAGWCSRAHPHNRRGEHTQEEKGLPQGLLGSSRGEPGTGRTGAPRLPAGSRNRCKRAAAGSAGPAPPHSGCAARVGLAEQPPRRASAERWGGGGGTGNAAVTGPRRGVRGRGRSRLHCSKVLGPLTRVPRALWLAALRCPASPVSRGRFPARGLRPQPLLLPSSQHATIVVQRLVPPVVAVRARVPSCRAPRRRSFSWVRETFSAFL